MSNRPLMPSYVVFSIGFYIRLCYSIGFDFSKAINSILDFRVSAIRINDFLHLNELKKIDSSSKENFPSIKIEELSFKWVTFEYNSVVISIM